jgi:transcriptional regulator with XRE-family HTH domain
MTKEELRNIRERHNLSQSAFGQLLGYNGNYISRLERGDENISQRFEKWVRIQFPQKKERKVKEAS